MLRLYIWNCVAGFPPLREWQVLGRAPSVSRNLETSPSKRETYFEVNLWHIGNPYGYKSRKDSARLTKPKFIPDDSKKCPQCQHGKIKKNGINRGRQRYQCKKCKHTFYRYQNSFKTANLYKSYSCGRQTLGQLSVQCGISPKTLQKKFDEHEPLKGEIKPILELIHVFMDATFFGRTFGVFVFRAGGKNIYWKIIHTESVGEVRQALDALDQICLGGYLGFTIDGKPGIRKLLTERYDVPVYMCLFHQLQIIRRYTTKNPQTSCGQDIRAFSLSLTKRNSLSAQTYFQVLSVVHRDFLRERNDNRQFMHKRLRSAFRSLKNNLPFLCLCHTKLAIRTTNSCEGSFSHLKSKVKIHRKLRLDRKIKMINFLLAHASNTIF